jgi:hypothetical protein
MGIGSFGQVEFEKSFHYCPANAGTIFSNSNVFNELR